MEGGFEKTLSSVTPLGIATESWVTFLQVPGRAIERRLERRRIGGEGWSREARLCLEGRREGGGSCGAVKRLKEVHGWGQRAKGALVDSDSPGHLLTINDGHFVDKTVLRSFQLHVSDVGQRSERMTSQKVSATRRQPQRRIRRNTCTREAAPGARKSDRHV